MDWGVRDPLQGPRCDASYILKGASYDLKCDWAQFLSRHDITSDLNDNVSKPVHLSAHSGKMTVATFVCSTIAGQLMTFPDLSLLLSHTEVSINPLLKDASLVALSARSGLCGLFLRGVKF